MAKIKVFDIDWCIEEEDVIDLIPDFEEYTDEVEEELNQKIREVKGELPEECLVDIDEVDLEDFDDVDLEDYICDELSDTYGWLINSFNYEIIKD